MYLKLLKLLAIWEVQMKVNLRLSLTPVRRTWLEKKNQLTVGEDAEKQIPNLLLVESKLL